MKNIVFCGVGGQGVILATKVLMQVAMNAGYDVKESEVHGMAQRGGSVDTHVRYGEKVHSPLIQTKTADFIVSFELLEAMRKIDLLKNDGTLIVNNDRIDPAPVQTGAMEYPSDIEEWITKNIENNFIVDTIGTLKEIGSRKALNIVMLGMLSNFIEFTQSQWEEAIKQLVKEKFVEMNLKAFQLGKELKSSN